MCHIDRAFAYTFRSENGSGQEQALRDVLVGLCKGHRIGHATDKFNVRWAGLSAMLTRKLRATADGTAGPDSALTTSWIARDDARNWVILGDPAVRLRVDKLRVDPV